MSQGLWDVSEVEASIRRGGGLLLAGDEAVLRRLPPGNWIGGTIPYFMTDRGGRVDRDRVYVNELPEGLRCLGVRRYGPEDVEQVYTDLPAGALGVVIAPAATPVHVAFALKAPGFRGFASRPLVGWIAGVHLSELGRRAPRVFDGTRGEALDQHAVVMQVALPPGKRAQLGLVNVFAEGDGPEIAFPSSGLVATEAIVGGAPRNLARWIREVGLDTRLPLVADYCGLGINVSFQRVDPEKGEVHFYAPVFAGVAYRHARPVADHVSAFRAGVPAGLAGRAVFSCNCIVNYVNAELEGKATGELVGPITFGEITYQLLNQTAVYLTIE